MRPETGVTRPWVQPLMVGRGSGFSPTPVDRRKARQCMQRGRYDAQVAADLCVQSLGASAPLGLDTDLGVRPLRASVPSGAAILLLVTLVYWYGVLRPAVAVLLLLPVRPPKS